MRRKKKKIGVEKENGGVRLLKRGRYGILRVIFSRAGIMLLLLLAQIMFLAFIFVSFERHLPYVYGVALALLILMVFVLLNSGGDPTSKITWLVITMSFPVFGLLLYWYTVSDIGHRALKRALDRAAERSRGLLERDETVADELNKCAPVASGLSEYLYRNGGFPVYRNTEVKYFPLGEDMFAALLTELERAERFIFMEYFTIEEGVFWGKILEILIRKANEGVEVRVLCDGTNEITTLSPDYAARLRAKGIKCKMFNSITPFFSTHYNYRDHRKITVIDGRVAFNGGINLADEYVNLKVKYGHWKDTAVLLRGDAVKSFTAMFMEMWDMNLKSPELSQYLTSSDTEFFEHEGFVIPYGDRPLDGFKVGERVYMDILNRAREYVYIMTPYLILDGEMETALKFAAERGVDVRLMLPGIPDKKVPYAIAKTYYASLMKSGVKIYEYVPGFVHAKVFVSDDSEAVVGTINLDYRSFYHHFECATYIYGAECIGEIKEDFLSTQEKCREVTKTSMRREKLSTKLM